MKDNFKPIQKATLEVMEENEKLTLEDFIELHKLKGDKSENLKLTKEAQEFVKKESQMIEKELKELNRTSKEFVYIGVKLCEIKIKK